MTSQDKIEMTIKIADELKEYLPLTLRQIFYQFVGKGLLENTKSQYTMLSNTLSNARIDGLLDWNIIADRTRVFIDNEGYQNKTHFINTNIKYFLKDYQRDLMQSQEKYIEIWIEKDALSSLFNKVCNQFCINVVVCKGFPSTTFLKNYKNRLDYQQNKQPVILYFGDLDPSGVEITETSKDKLISQLNISELELKRLALLPEHIQIYNLPHSIEALKMTDTRAKKYIKKYGMIAVELDALRPDILINIIEQSILNEINIDLFNNEKQEQYNETIEIKDLKQKIIEFISTV